VFVERQQIRHHTKHCAAVQVTASKKRKHDDISSSTTSASEPAEETKGSKMMKMMGWKYV
jgi:hypothetical protein